jgi:hypothetical protein
MCNLDFLDLAASLGKFFRLSCGKAGGGREVPWSDTLHRESVGRVARRCVDGRGVCSPMCMSDPCNSSKGIVKGRVSVPT